ncbi:MAG: M15 family metallopeptidase [Acidimicrobiales bacterium]
MPSYSIAWSDRAGPRVPVPARPTSLRPGHPPHARWGQAVGELVVDAEVAEDIVAVFAELFAVAFPIESLRLVDDFGADDLRSMQANNTSAFNCRFVAGTSTWSWHAFGRAIDLNPLVNPYVTPNGIDPPEGSAYADRSQQVPGMIQPGDAVTSGFATIGWAWGGSWAGGQDYQHFDRRDG